jgi:oligopeptide/dipeptide ABC transporter ATP-binding protein
VRISHDLALVAVMVDWIVVLYAGQVVESGTPARVLGDPRLPYTIGLIRAQLSLEEPGRPSTAIPGVVPAPSRYPSGCRVRARCARALDHSIEPPTLAPAGASGRLACHNPGSLDAP